MGKVPDVLTDDEGWKLNRLNYYQEGWLATGSARGIVGVTFTACHCKKMFEGPPRTNFNLRGHRNEVCSDQVDTCIYMYYEHINWSMYVQMY